MDKKLELVNALNIVTGMAYFGLGTDHHEAKEELLKASHLIEEALDNDYGWGKNKREESISLDIANQLSKHLENWKPKEKSFEDVCPYMACPKCDSQNISADHIDPENFYRNIYCEDCGYDWTEYFAFVGNELPDLDENEN